MKLKLIVTIIALRFTANAQKIKLGSICVETPYKADTRVRTVFRRIHVTAPAKNRRETSVLIRTAIRTFPFKTRRKSPISTSIAYQK